MVGSTDWIVNKGSRLTHCRCDQIYAMSDIILVILRSDWDVKSTNLW